GPRRRSRRRGLANRCAAAWRASCPARHDRYARPAPWHKVSRNYPGNCCFCPALAEVLHGPGNVPGAISNPNCAEPVNFAYLTKHGTPIGPPGPDTQKNQSFKPTNNVLRMNQGDVITVNIHDTAAGLSAAVTDHSTGGSGSMVASVANGFRHILFDPVHLTCNGPPYAFHPKNNTAAAPTATGQPTAWTTWAAHPFNISQSGEIGHFEPVDGDGDDSFCIHGPVIPGCTGTDSDFDGYAYHADWPNGSANFAT